MNNEEKDFSIRYEAKMMVKETLGMTFTDDQIGRIVDEVVSYETFLDVLSIFLLKGIETVAEEDGIVLDEEAIHHQYHVCRQGLNYADM